MKRHLLTALGLLAVLALFAPVGAAAGQATVLRVKQPSAGGEAWLKHDCPDNLDPVPVGMSCRETYVIAWRESGVIGGGSIAPSKAPWRFFATSYTVTFTSADADYDVSDVIEGFTDQNIVASSDDQRVSNLSVTATVQMTDGSTFAFDGTWTGRGDRWVYGNNGPQHGAEGLPRHAVDKCETFNSNDHQTGRNAALVATVNGQPVETYTAFPSADIFYNHFIYVDVAHGGC